MMRIKKENLSNLAFIIVLALMLFTPVGFHVRVLVSRIFSFSPSVLSQEEQSTISNYEWKLASLDGESLDFESLEGKVVLVNFWATWCPPCVAEMPGLQKLYDDYGDDVEFVFIAHDDPEKVSTFLNKKQYIFPVYFEMSSSPELLSSDEIPTTYVIDKTGRITVAKTGSADWNSTTTRELLNDLIEKE